MATAARGHVRCKNLSHFAFPHRLAIDVALLGLYVEAIVSSEAADMRHQSNRDHQVVRRCHSLSAGGLWLCLVLAALLGCEGEGLIAGPEVTADGAGHADGDIALAQTDAATTDAVHDSDAPPTPDADPNPDAGQDVQSDADTVAETDAEAETDAQTATDALAETDALTDTGAPNDTDTLADTDTHTGSDAQAGADTPAETDAEAGTDVLGEPDAQVGIDMQAGADSGTASDGGESTDAATADPDAQSPGSDTMDSSSDAGAAELPHVQPDAPDAAEGSDMGQDPDSDSTDQLEDGVQEDTSLLDVTDAGAADAGSFDPDSTGSDATPLTDALDDTGQSADAGADGDVGEDADTIAPVSCTSDAPCLPLGKVCDPLIKQCVGCLWDDDCGVLAECIDRVCVGIVPCQNSLYCLTAVGAEGEPLSICDQQAGQCVACLSDPDCGDGFVCKNRSCEPVAACQNSIACGVDQVCDTEQGVCVECLSPADCGPSQLCEAGKCTDFVACASDKQCTPLGMLCNTAKGKCASCLQNSDCPAVYHCAATGPGGTGECALDICQQGESRCDGNAIVNCNAVGDGWTAPSACPGQTTCTASGTKASCSPWVCAPGASCSGGSAIACSADGLSVTSSTNCAENGSVCDAGQCKTPICAPASSWCDGAALQTCSANGLVVTSSPACASGSHCTPTGCAPNVCAPGQPACVGQTAGTCNANGSGLIDGATPCGELLCVQGQCKPLVCVPSATTCNGNTKETCSADGLSVVASVPCLTNEYCQNGSCLPHVCSPNQPVCDGQTARICNSQGSGFAGDGTACDPQLQLCKNGSCQTKVCTPSVQFCDDNALATCSADGLSVVAVVPCPQHMYCSGGACLPTVCTPNAQGCNGNIAATCNANGSSWLSGGVDCSSTEQICSGGVCKSLVCNPLQPQYCVGDAVYNCASDGLSTSLFKTCSSNEYCSSGACVTQLCAPGSAGCLGNQPAVCNAQGSALTPSGNACGLGTSCAGGVCINCVPTGAEVCDGLDNDCNGLVDEASDGPLCNDNNDCTSDICADGGSCQFVPVAVGSPCGDADGCMVGRTCSAGGVCQAGSSRFHDTNFALAPDAASWLSAVAVLPGGDVVVSAVVGTGRALVRLDRSGKVVWQTSAQLDSPSYELQTDALGGIYITTSTAVKKFNAFGAFQWSYPTARRAALRVVPSGGAWLLMRTESVQACEGCGGLGSKCKSDTGTNLLLTRLGADGTVVSTAPIDHLYASTAKRILQPDALIFGHNGELVATLLNDGICDIFEKDSLLRLSTTGTTIQWIEQASNSGFRELHRTSSGFVMLQSSGYAWFDKSLVQTGTKSVTADSIAVAANGDIFTSTKSNVTTPGGTATITTVRRYSPGGALRWTKVLDYSAIGSAAAAALAADNDGPIVVGRRTINELDRAWVVRLDDWGHSSCSASGDCWQTSVLACAACSAEVCDNVDNDCNGMTDELACDDGNPCNSATCNGASCVSAAVDGGPCQDNNACTNGDTCLAGTCTSGLAWNCDDGNPCTTDSCSTPSGCSHALLDGCQPVICTPGSGGCLGTQPTVCNSTGSAQVPSGNACTVGTVCSAGSCVACVATGSEVCDGTDNDCDGAVDEAGEAPLCNDDNDCTADTCSAAGTCAHTPVAAGQPCGADDACVTGRVCGAEGTCLAGSSRFFDTTQVIGSSPSAYVSVARLPGGDLVAVTNDGWLVRAGNGGSLAWTTAVLGLGTVHEVVSDVDGAIYASGTSGVRKYSDSGVVQWTYPTARRAALTAHPQGGVYALIRSQSYKHCVQCGGSWSTKCNEDMGHQLALIRLGSSGAELANVVLDPMPVVSAVYQLDPSTLLWTSDGHLAAMLATAEVCAGNRTSLIKLSTAGQILQWRPDVGPYARLISLGTGHGLRYADSFERLDKDLQSVSTTPLTTSSAAGLPSGELFTVTASSVVTPGGTFSVQTVRRYAADGSLRWSKVFDYSGQGSVVSGATMADATGFVLTGRRSVSGSERNWLVQMDGWGYTSCEDSGDCWQTSLESCAACAAEVCDGVDNDCNGATDEQTCADPSACASSTCSNGACVWAVSDAQACLDGNPCTQDDVCLSGYCSAGQQNACDDADPCTADSCDTQSGCQHTPVDGPACGG